MSSPKDECHTAGISPDAPRSAAKVAPRSMFVFTAEKAGMKGVDKQHVQEVVHNMSKNSSFYQKSLRDNEKVEQRVHEMRKKLACMTSGQLLRLEQETDARVAQMEATRDLSRIVVVVDMDMFYAAIEMRDNPKLRDVPLAVGGLNMISTTNYVARQYGVRAAMPGFIGKELCPKLCFVPVNMDKYKRVADLIRAVFAEYDPDFEAFSLDEACLDLTAYVSKNWQNYVSAAQVDTGIRYSDEKEWASTATGRAEITAIIVRELRKKIFECTQLTASAGIAVNVMLAKICSDINKPNGQYVLPFTRESVMNFIRELPVRKIGGIGKVTEKVLSEALNVHTGAELFAKRGKIAFLFSEKTAEWLLQTSLGVQKRRDKQERKSFSRERTFSRLSDPTQLELKCKEICNMLANDLDRAGKAAKNVTLVYKDTYFARSSRAMTLASAIYSADDLFANAVELLRRELPITLRLMGVRASALVSRPKHSEMFDSSQTRLTSKKRQVAINEFAEKVDDAAALFAFGDAGGRGNAIKTTETLDDECRRKISKKGDILHAFTPKVNPKSTSEVDNEPCPICGKLLNVRNNVEVNAHMDMCIINKKATCKGSKNDISRAFARIQDSSRGDSDKQPCPICGKLLNVKKSLEINAHMDVCVSQNQS
ncbi:hypothetical protein PsorP6_003829 [Peronosclerospora sorghi]|uniref:Uncharacterized protein n=1 Tax=Peronosclerospora sorghi TaxID=230839 RepID=A0ACC0VNG6_9STRA|nr:hypothetical protein PsorP6_003829 [Peronosclerospora sorghi]